MNNQPYDQSYSGGRGNNPPPTPPWEASPPGSSSHQEGSSNDSPHSVGYGAPDQRSGYTGQPGDSVGQNQFQQQEYPQQYGQQQYPQQYGQQQYPPQPYGYQQPPQAPGKGLAITALVLGICSLLFSWVPIFNIFTSLAALVGLVMGIIALVQIKKGAADGKAMATVGTGLSALAIIITIAITMLIFGSMNRSIDGLNRDISETNSDLTWSAPAAEETESQLVPLGSNSVSF